MAFVPGFEFDVFISYSHANNQSQWVTRFRDKLRERLKEFIGGDPVVFLDTQTIQGNEELTRKLNTSVTRAAVLAPIVSRSYITRPWCRDECQLFRTKHVDSAAASNIFPVRYDDVSPAEFQSLVGERIGYFFFGLHKDAKYADAWELDSDEFKRQMNTLRTEIGKQLLTMKEQREMAPANVSPTDNVPPQTVVTVPASRPVVLLAESTRHLDRFRDGLTGFLRGYQIEVLRPGDRFYAVPGFEQTFAKQVQDADLVVQLLGRFFDPHDDETVHSWDQWQSRQAESASKPMLRWFHKFDKDNRELDLTLLDATHRRFVKGPGVWDNDFELFKRLVYDEAMRRHQARMQQERVEAAVDYRPLIVLRSDKADVAFAEQIGQQLKAHRCEWVRIPDKDVTSLEEFSHQYTADGLLVVYRSCPGRWVLTRLQELRKFLKSDAGRRWSCGLWRAPEDETDALSCSMDGLIVIEPPEQMHLPEFVASLHKRLGAIASGVL